MPHHAHQRHRQRHLQTTAFPDLAGAGAYAPYLTYTAADMAGIVSYATARGVRVLPEFDVPVRMPWLLQLWHGYGCVLGAGVWGLCAGAGVCVCVCVCVCV